MSRHAIKKKRLESIYKEVIAEAILCKLDDVRLNINEFTLSRVSICDEWRTADVYISTDSHKNPNKIIKALYAAAPFFLHILKSKVKIKFLPKMRFHFDKNLNEANDVVDLINKLSKKAPPSL